MNEFRSFEQLPDMVRQSLRELGCVADEPWSESFLIREGRLWGVRFVCEEMDAVFSFDRSELVATARDGRVVVMNLRDAAPCDEPRAA